MTSIHPPASTRRHILVTLAAIGLPAFAAHAHGPTPQKIDERIDIAAPAAMTWALVGDFANFAAWNPALAASSADKGNAVNSVRTLTFAEGGKITEEMDEYLADEMSLSYRSGRVNNLNILPVGSYSVRLRVIAQGSGSRIEWRCRAYRADTGNEPAQGMDDAAAIQALRDHIRPALETAKRKLEQPSQ